MAPTGRGLQGALDNDVKIAAEKFIEQGIPADSDKIYTAIQRSNSSLKRKPKRVIIASLDRILDFLDDGDDGDDSEADAEQESLARSNQASDIMNRSLRANLAGPSAAPSPPVTSDEAGIKRQRAPNGESLPKKQKTERISVAPPGDLNAEDIGGMDEVLTNLTNLLMMPLYRPEEYITMDLGIPRGILLHGPPGCGKTMVSRAFAAELGVPFIELLGPSIVSGMSGESEKGIRDRFEEARKQAPCLMFIDEIDAIAPKRESSQSQMEKRIVAQLLVSMDELGRDPTKPVIVLAATNRPDAIDPALRRGGRFDTEINIGVPNEQTRASILRAQTRNTSLSTDVDFHYLAKRTAGFVGADLKDLVAKAGSWQMNKFREALMQQARELQSEMDVDMNTDTTKPPPSLAVSNLRLLRKCLLAKDLPRPPGFTDRSIAMTAFEAVLPQITPSSKREGFATIPTVSWSDIGALAAVRRELQDSIVGPIQNPEMYAKVGISAPTGVLLWGPPGCGKTLLAKAVAAESKANFISVQGPELLNKFVGESEAAVRRVFARARSSVPCVVFFDEVDALVPRRDGQMSEASARVVNTMLTELDGQAERAGIHVIGATNRPDVIDEALLRPGRLGQRLFVDLPGPEERVEILRTLVRGKPYPNGVEEIARMKECEGYSGADLGSMVQAAARNTLARGSTDVTMEDFENAAKTIKGSVGDMRKYYKLRDKFGHSM